MTLEERVSQIIYGPTSLHMVGEVLLECLEAGEENSLASLLRLTSLREYHVPAPDNTVLRYSAAAAATYWGRRGLAALSQLPSEDDQNATISVVASVLAYAASGTMENIPFVGDHPDFAAKLDLTSAHYRSEEFMQTARSELVKLMLQFLTVQSTDMAIVQALHNLSCMNSKAFNVLFAAASHRWFRVNNQELEHFAGLLNQCHVGEELVQNYLETHPYILDPFYAQIWPKAPLGESLVVDFLIRLMDDHYVLVEIEKPGDPITNKKGDLSAQTTHAVRQALEYQDWVISNLLYAKQRFPNIWRPTCLVVIGMESNLNGLQKARLRQENEAHHGTIKIVGFDWLLHRASTIHDNLINHGFRRFGM